MNEEVIIEDQGSFLSNVLTANDSTLRHDDHLLYKSKIEDIARDKLNGIADLQAKGLINDLGGLGTSVVYYEKQSDMTGADITMDGEALSQNDRLTIKQAGIPVPIFRKDFRINKRFLESSRKSGTPISTRQVATATRKVSEALEKALFMGVDGLQFEGLSLYGYTNHPDRNTFGLKSSGWGDTANRDIIGDVKQMLQAMYDDNRFGPFVMYVAKNIYSELLTDYSSVKTETTFREKILKFPGIERIDYSATLPDDHVLLIQMNSEVIELAVASDIKVVEAPSWDMMSSRFMVYASMSPMIMSDYNGSCGIVHGTPSS